MFNSNINLSFSFGLSISTQSINIVLSIDSSQVQFTDCSLFAMFLNLNGGSFIKSVKSLCCNILNLGLHCNTELFHVWWYLERYNCFFIIRKLQIRKGLGNLALINVVFNIKFYFTVLKKISIRLSAVGFKSGTDKDMGLLTNQYLF